MPFVQAGTLGPSLRCTAPFLMKAPLTCTLLAIAGLHHPQATAQCTVNSTTGYSVHIHVQALAIEPSSTNCPWGYQYNTRLIYDIAFSGENIPSR